jgi:hypothetical protein
MHRENNNQPQHTPHSNKARSWIYTQACDAETLVEITCEMMLFFLAHPLEMDDSRCFYRLCIDMALYFQELHANTDWESTDFLSAIIAHANTVKPRLVRNPSWINTNYKWMYGTQTISDLLSEP